LLEEVMSELASNVVGRGSSLQSRQAWCRPNCEGQHGPTLSRYYLNFRTQS
jgi:hypothetical protein